MIAGFETYDDARTLMNVRARMRDVLLTFGVVSCGTIILAPFLAIWTGEATWVPLAAALWLSLSAGLCIRRLTQLRRCTWRVAVSCRHVIVIDVGLRQRTVAWGALERIEVDPDGLTLVARGMGDEEVRLHILGRFASYVDLAHRLVALAERRRLAVWIDGLPWQHLDVDRLFPTLRADLAGEPR